MTSSELCARYFPKAHAAKTCPCYRDKPPVKIVVPRPDSTRRIGRPGRWGSTN